MHRRLLLLAVLALSQPAFAQDAPSTPGLGSSGAGTVLRLTETADVTRVPDEIRATLRAEARETTAAAAQNRVNQAMAGALDAARAAPGVIAATGGYRTWRQEDPSRWLASQTLTLRGPDATRLLELVGTLQSRGLAADGITYTLTRDATRAARQEAASVALDVLRGRADAVAAQLGTRVARIAEVRIGGSESVPRPMAMAARERSVSSYSAPVAQADDIVVQATVEAVVVLAP